ncbi:hypothetical protein ACFSCX_05930 [Bacillus salitolerans]|uniref:Uncharacterized protein n=1 Tax=Bacillus salitolerans TaxID=1437434 RepID=A0ABW4LLN7_9BACI
MKKRLIPIFIILLAVVIITPKYFDIKNVEAFSYTSVNSLPITITANKTSSGVWNNEYSWNHSAQVYSGNLKITDMRVDNGVTEVRFSGYVTLNYSSYGAGSQSYLNTTFTAKLNNNYLPLITGNNGNSYNSVAKWAEWYPDTNTWFPTSNGSLNFHFESRGYTSQNGTNYSQVVATEIGTINLNSAPTLSLSTSNNQILSEISGKNLIELTGNVKDQNSGDSLLIKYSVDGLASYQNIVLP